MSDAARLQPPLGTQAIDPTTQDHAPAWAEHHQKVTDKLADIQSKIDTINSTLSALSTGVVDGSDAAAGHVGEFMQATSGNVALTSGVNAVTASLNLAPGDWQVDGNVLFTPSVAAHATQLQVASGTSSTTLFYATNLSATFATGVGTLLSIGYPTRFSFSAATTVYVVAGSAFTGGTMTARGTISARRMR